MAARIVARLVIRKHGRLNQVGGTLRRHVAGGMTHSFVSTNGTLFVSPAWSHCFRAKFYAPGGLKDAVARVAGIYPRSSCKPAPVDGFKGYGRITTAAPGRPRSLSNPRSRGSRPYAFRGEDAVRRFNVKRQSQESNENRYLSQCNVRGYQVA